MTERPISITTQIATPSEAAFNLTPSVSASDALPIVESADEEPTTLKKWSIKSTTESPPRDRSTKIKGLPEHTYCAEQIISFRTLENKGIIEQPAGLPHC